MFKILAFGIAALTAGMLGVAASQPDTFEVERSAVIKAPPHELYRLVNDFHQWAQWSPWERMDPAMRRRYNGPASGTGSLYAWEGNNKVGKGQMEIIESSAPTQVVVKLDFLEPFEAHNTSVFRFTPQGDGTAVTWSMHGPNLFLGKVVGLFVSTDRLVGADFETGLANLKAVAEK